MNKTAQQLQDNISIIEEQSEKIAQQEIKITELSNTSENKEFVEYRKHKLAFDVAELMIEKELTDPEEFQATVNTLFTKSADELKQRKNYLDASSVDTTLELGTVDTKEPKIATQSNGSKTPLSLESSDAANNLINTILTEE